MILASYIGVIVFLVLNSTRAMHRVFDFNSFFFICVRVLSN